MSIARRWLLPTGLHGKDPAEQRANKQRALTECIPHDSFACARELFMRSMLARYTCMQCKLGGSLATDIGVVSGNFGSR